MTYDEIQLLNMYRKLTPGDKRVIIRTMEFDILMEKFIEQNNGIFDRVKFDEYKQQFYSPLDEKKCIL